MSKVAKVVGTVASVVAFAAGVAIMLGVPGGQLIGIGLITLSQVAAGASAIAAVSMAIAQATAKPPDAKGSVSQVMIGKNMAVPYALGRTYCGGMQIYDKSGGEDNKDRSQIMVVSAAGPIDGFEWFIGDYSIISIAGFASAGAMGAASGYYATYLWASSRLGNRPETAFAGVAGRAALPEWGAAYKLSGYAAYALTMKFDKDGKRFSSGVPQWGATFRGVRVYDPRFDSTYPGGSGGNRWNDESTFIYASPTAVNAGENPALHALTYARGRYIEKDAAGVPLATPVKICGCGFTFDQIEVDQFVELANLCDANGWRVGGLIYEGPGLSKWDNLKRILAACAAEPVWSGGKLGVRICAPRVPVVTIGLPDLADGELSVQAMRSFRDKVNSVIPRVRLENQKWEYTQLEEVSSATYLAEDGETKSTEVQFDLVQQANQGAELAAYTLVNGREFGPINLPLKPAFMIYKVGEAVSINIPELGLEDQLAVIIGRQVDPANGSVVFSLESETTAKHDFALGRTGVAPPTPTIVPPEELDQVTGALDVGTAAITELILNSSPRNLTLSITTAGIVTISNHDRVYSDKIVAVNGATTSSAPSGTVAGDMLGIYYDDPDRVGGSTGYVVTRIPGGIGEVDFLFASAENPYRHMIALLTVPAAGSGPGSGGSGVGQEAEERAELAEAINRRGNRRFKR